MAFLKKDSSKIHRLQWNSWPPLVLVNTLINRISASVFRGIYSCIDVNKTVVLMHKLNSFNAVLDFL